MNTQEELFIALLEGDEVTNQYGETLELIDGNAIAITQDGKTFPQHYLVPEDWE